MTRSSKPQSAVLALADGTLFKGFAFGALAAAENPAIGEVVFNTSMYGYQEILTDPSYAGQIMTFTAPHIGNVGCNKEDVESGVVHVEGVVVRQLSPISSNFRAEMSFSDYLAKNGKMGFAGVDTREIVLHLRTHGAQMGAMAVGDEKIAKQLIAAARAQGSMEGKDYVRFVSCKESYSWNELPWERGVGYQSLSQERLSARPHVVAIDCGIKSNILRLLTNSGFRLSVVPVTHTSQQILSLNPDALFLSNGPGDPATLGYVVETTKALLGRFPIFGICLGHQILGQVMGAKTYKLRFGHRGGNHPVMDLKTNKVEITVQNHGFAVDEKTLSKEAVITHRNLNDQTVEGLEVPGARAFSVQYHPEASPGPHDSGYLFKRFWDSVVGG